MPRSRTSCGITEHSHQHHISRALPGRRTDQSQRRSSCSEAAAKKKEVPSGHQHYTKATGTQTVVTMHGAPATQKQNKTQQRGRETAPKPSEVLPKNKKKKTSPPVQVRIAEHDYSYARKLKNQRAFVRHAICSPPCTSTRPRGASDGMIDGASLPGNEGTLLAEEDARAVHELVPGLATRSEPVLFALHNDCHAQQRRVGRQPVTMAQHSVSGTYKARSFLEQHAVYGGY